MLSAIHRRIIDTSNGNPRQRQIHGYRHEGPSERLKQAVEKLMTRVSRVQKKLSTQYASSARFTSLKK